MTGQQALAWLNTQVCAIDIDPQAVADLRAIVAAWFMRHHQMTLPPEALTGLHCANGLSFPENRRFDLAIGNPPYVRFQTLDVAQRTWLSETFSSCASGNVDLYYAFIERALDIANRVGFIVPNSFLSTRSGQRLRTRLEGRVEQIIDYGARRVFPGVGTYTCLLFAGSGSPGLVVDATTGHTQPFMAQPVHPKPVRAVRSGIATLCDKAYAVERRGEQFFARLTGLPVERDLVRPLVKITKFRGADETWDQFILFPYQRGELLSPAQMEAFPQARAHLDAVRSLLDARDRGKKTYEQWYAYGRAQGLKDIKGPEALLVPAMMGGQSQPRLANLAPLFAWGAPVFCSGYVIDQPTSEDIEAIMSDRFGTTVAAHGAAKPGAKGEIYHTVSSWMVKGQT